MPTCILYACIVPALNKCSLPEDPAHNTCTLPALRDYPGCLFFAFCLQSVVISKQSGNFTATDCGSLVTSVILLYTYGVGILSPFTCRCVCVCFIPASCSEVHRCLVAL